MCNNCKEVVVHVLDEWAEIIMLLYNLSIMKRQKWRNGVSAIFNTDCEKVQRAGKTLSLCSGVCSHYTPLSILVWIHCLSEDVFCPGLSNWSGIDSRELMQTQIHCLSSQKVSTCCVEHNELRTSAHLIVLTSGQGAQREHMGITTDFYLVVMNNSEDI